MIRIEFEEPTIEICKCCNNEIVKLTRFVFKDEDAFAVYYLKFTKGHEDKFAIGLISIGDWGTDKEPKNRFSFPFRLWVDETDYQVGLIDKEESPWKQDLLGTILDRKEALEHPWIDEVFHITDHIVDEDKILIEYFFD
ncbi:hypothetical protein EV143_11062 [Flavobacterium chryseum]|uniref:hypothetical protein n=1 Tax=Flavobacterium sp. P3160 TaxID=2512113 RepID=UPI00105B7461|nr:hypothetical protein [Flavobacterium sp. P3160]TDO71070.1 hypothetical protein EV143_11062 [Flavobacterium sp. P3160]